MEEPLLGGTAELAPQDSLLRCGNTNCGGCGMSIGLNMLGRAAVNTRIQMVIPACCGIVTAGAFPFSAYGAPVVAATFASAAAVATGLAQVARLNGDDTRVVAWAGDGGTYDIGLSTLSAAAERNEDVLYVCYDNEIYGNTGGQRSSATPLGASTTTTPQGKAMPKKDILGIMAAHRVPYVASISLADPEDTMRKMKFALECTGFRFLHMLSPCPTGWKSEPAEGVELIRLAVKSGLYAVYEVFDGVRTVIDGGPDPEPERRAALERYFAQQGRFRKSEICLDTVAQEVSRNWRQLRRRAREED